MSLAESRQSIMEAAKEQLDQQKRLLADNERLRKELEDLKQLSANKEQENLKRLENVFQAHKMRTDTLTQQHHDALLLAHNTHHATLDAV